MTNDERQQRRERIKTAAKAGHAKINGSAAWDDLTVASQESALDGIEAAAIAAEWEDPLPADPPVETTGHRLASDYAIGAITLTQLASGIDAAIAEDRPPVPSPAPQAEVPRYSIGEMVDRFLGWYGKYDLYYRAPVSRPGNLIAVEGHDCYVSRSSFPDHPAIIEARRRAIDAGLIAGPGKPAESPAEDPAWRAGEIELALEAFRLPGSPWESMEAALVVINHIRPCPAPREPAQPDDDNSYVSVPPKPREPRPKPAPVPAVIETPEEMAERVAAGAAGDWVDVIGCDRRFATKSSLACVRKILADIICERDAAYAAQLAQAREAALEEARQAFINRDGRLGMADEAVFDRLKLKARPVAAGGK